MHYEVHDGLEIPRAFRTENQWIGALKNFGNGEPADSAIKALEGNPQIICYENAGIVSVAAKIYGA